MCPGAHEAMMACVCVWSFLKHVRGLVESLEVVVESDLPLVQFVCT